MFDEFIRELDRLPATKGVEITIDMPLDEKGYFDRKCPHEQCGALFKVMFDDWGDKVSDGEAYCPKCGTRADPDEFYTAEQNAYIEQSAEEYLSDQLDQAFSQAARRTKPRRISSGLFDITMGVSYKASPITISLPPIAHDVLRQDIRCEPCGCRWSVVGTGYFCPACRHNSVLRDFDSTVDTILNVLDRLEDIKAAVAKKSDIDVAVNVEQLLVEDQVENLVSAFQRLSEALFCELPNATSFPFDPNLFQRIDDASDLWCRATGRSYSAHLSAGELEEMKAMVQRRHKLSHNQGMVDQRYVDKSGDLSYEVGQRLVIRAAHVRSLAKSTVKLANGLRETVTAVNS